MCPHWCLIRDMCCKGILLTFYWNSDGSVRVRNLVKISFGFGFGFLSRKFGLTRTECKVDWQFNTRGVHSTWCELNTTKYPDPLIQQAATLYLNYYRVLLCAAQLEHLLSPDLFYSSEISVSIPAQLVFFCNFWPKPRETGKISRIKENRTGTTRLVTSSFGLIFSKPKFSVRSAEMLKTRPDRTDYSPVCRHCLSIAVTTRIQYD